jgi:hypothetical protein
MEGDELKKALEHDQARREQVSLPTVHEQEKRQAKTGKDLAVMLIQLACDQVRKSLMVENDKLRSSEEPEYYHEQIGKYLTLAARAIDLAVEADRISDRAIARLPTGAADEPR